MSRYLGLDLGGTKLAVGVADEAGRLLAQRRAPTDGQAGPEGALATLSALVHDLGDLARPVDGIGVSFGGPVAPDRQTTLLSHHGPGWEQFPLAERAASLWNAPVEMDNDANAAALGEALFGAARRDRDILYLTVSTGIGGGIVIDRKLYRGSRGLAGEIGHTIVVPDGPLCPCGKRGCLEAVAAGPMIARAYAEAAGEPAAPGAEEVFQRAARGDPVAEEILNRAIEGLGLGIANAINLLDPDVVVLGGGVTRAGDALFVPLRKVVRRHGAPAPPGAVPIRAAALGDAVGVLGAIALVRDR